MSCGSATCTSAIPFRCAGIARDSMARVPAWRMGARIVVRRTAASPAERLLADIGVSRADAFAEARKPFWL
jgi:uncharacterized protein YjiS (DUF1127 family)